MLRGQLFPDFAGRRNVWHERHKHETTKTKYTNHETRDRLRVFVYICILWVCDIVCVCERGKRPARPIGIGFFFFGWGQGIFYRLHSSKSILNLTCRSAPPSSRIPSRDIRCLSTNNNQQLLIMSRGSGESYHQHLTVSVRKDDFCSLLALLGLRLCRQSRRPTSATASCDYAPLCCCCLCQRVRRRRVGDGCGYFQHVPAHGPRLMMRGPHDPNPPPNRKPALRTT
jgi:hypothetical protein